MLRKETKMGKRWKRGLSYICLTFLLVGLFWRNAANLTVYADSTVDNSAAEGVVAVLTLDQMGYGARGSGFFVGASGENPQYIVTNCHVIDSAINDGNYTVYIAFSKEDFVEAEIVAYGDYAYVDLAVLKIAEPTDKRHPLQLMVPDQSSMKGCDVWALGFPGNAENQFSNASRFGVDDVTFSDGKIKRFVKNAGKQVERIAVSAQIQHGHSGGPLITAEGYVIGVNCNVESNSPYEGQVEADYYAINTSELISFLDKNEITYELANADTSDNDQSSETITDGQNQSDSREREKNGAPTMLIVLAVVLGMCGIGAVAVIVWMNKKKSPAPQSVSAAPAPVSRARGPVARSLSSQHNGLSVSLSSKPIMVGRDRTVCAIVYAEGTAGVSGKHCTIAFDPAIQSYVVTDIGSSYGTFLMNGQRLQPNVPCRLKAGDSFYVGDRSNVIRLELG